MDYTFPLGSSQPPFFLNNDHSDMSLSLNSQVSAQDIFTAMDSSWSANLDPTLRTPSGDLRYPVQGQQQQHPIQRFVGEQQRTWFTAPFFPDQQSFPRGLNRQTVPVSTFPHASTSRMDCPSPLQELASTCTDASSPADDADWLGDSNIYPSIAQSPDLFGFASQPSQGVNIWSGQPNMALPQLPSSFDCVNPSQVQLFSDATEANHDADEGYDDMRTGYALSVDHFDMKTEKPSQSYPYPGDEAIGPSIKGSASPHISTIHYDDENGSDVDAEGEAEDVVEEEEEAVSDTEYVPEKNARKRRASNARSVTQQSPKRSRVSKSTQKQRGSLFCKQCSHAPFKDAASLQNHISKTHTRAYSCVFDFAGCTSNFSSKNEWKRHVSSQHLNLHSWVCTQGHCANATHISHSTHLSHPSILTSQGAEFNRKDLFTQHCRRMHSPSKLKRPSNASKKDAQFEDQLKAWQISCMRVKRQAPTRLACPVDSCGELFEGSGAWDERMEHVGKHLERAGNGKEGKEVRQGDDDFLVEWALDEGIIEFERGVYKLIGGSGMEQRRSSTAVNGRKRIAAATFDEDEEDAECEEE